jgi:serine/threonine protein kinase
VHLLDAVESNEGVRRLGELLKLYAHQHFMDFSAPFVSEMLVEVASVLRRLAGRQDLREELKLYDIPELLSLLLGSTHPIVSRTVLETLLTLVRSPDMIDALARTSAVELLLRILNEYSSEYTLLAATLLNTLCISREVSQNIRILRGNLVLINQFLKTKDQPNRLALLSIVQTLSSDLANITEFRKLGMVQALLKVIRASDDALLMLSALLTLTLLAREDESCLLMRANGAHLVGRCLVRYHPRRLGRECAVKEAEIAVQLQLHALRLTRFLYSLERNRKAYRNLFPPAVLSSFAVIPDYTQELSAYQSTLALLNSLSDAQLEQLEQAVEQLKELPAGTRIVGGYKIVELLSKGVFGCVYEVIKGENRYALKEMTLTSSEDVSDSEKLAEQLSKEVAIYKELSHPNIVKYYSSFMENHNLYIVTELEDGQSLADYLTSLRDKGQRLSEGQLWRLVIDLCTALRYLHMDKRLVHRDFTPASLLVTRELQAKIADFGLAKHWSSGHFMKSFVGTVAYAAPEVVQSRPYNEKADIWAFGCVLYELATLQPAFAGNSPMAVGKRILEGSYEPLDPQVYSQPLIHMVRSCLTVDQDNRPDILGLCQMLAPLLIMQIDNLKEKETQIGAQLVHARERSAEEPRAAVRTQTKDPVTPLIEALHKLLYITQLPPGLTLDPRRSRLEAFKHWLFAEPQGTERLKAELSKLLTSSHDETPLTTESVSYEVLGFTLEEVLSETSYYETPAQDSR